MESSNSVTFLKAFNTFLGNFLHEYPGDTSQMLLIIHILTVNKIIDL